MTQFIPSTASFQDRFLYLCPTPDEKIVLRLTNYYRQPDFGIRAPWQPAPRMQGIPVEKIKFHARVLTLLAKAGIYPPPLLQVAGGPPKPGGILEGPVLFVPEGKTQQRYLNRTSTEAEAKRNAFSSQSGSLADGAEGMVEIEMEPKQLTALERYQRSIDEKFNSILREDGITRVPPPLQPSFDTRPWYTSENLAEIDNDIEHDLYLSDNKENVPEEIKIPTINIISGARRWASGIRRRAPWQRFSRRKREEIEMESKIPVFSIDMSEADDEDEDEEPLGGVGEEVKHEPTPAEVTWWNSMTENVRQHKFTYIWLTSLFFVLPARINFPYMIYKRLESEEPDPLMLLYYKLRADNWFRANFSPANWQFIIKTGDRPKLFVFMSSITADVFYFDRDISRLWHISKAILEKRDLWAIQVFGWVVYDILFRVSNNELLKKFTASKTLRHYDWCYILSRINEQSRVVCETWMTTQRETENVLTAFADAHKLIMVDDNRANRLSNFDSLVSVLQTINNLAPFSDPWVEKVVRLARNCSLFDSLKEEAFIAAANAILKDPLSYPNYSKGVVEAFLNRYFGKTKSGFDAELGVFSGPISEALASNKSLVNPVTELLNFMDMYKKRDTLDSIAYEVANNRFAQHHSFGNARSFQDALDKLDLSDFRGVSSLEWDFIFQLVSACKMGFMSELKKTETDVLTIKANGIVPPNLGRLYNQGPIVLEKERAEILALVDVRRDSSATALPGRRLLDDTVLPQLVSASVATLFFSSAPNYVITQLQDKLIFYLPNLQDYSSASGLSGFISVSPPSETHSTELVLYSKEFQNTPNGLVFLSDTWNATKMYFYENAYMLSVATAGFVISLGDPDFFLTSMVLKSGADLSKSLISTAWRSSMWTKVAVVGSAGVVAVYGPNKVKETIENVVKGVVNYGPLLILGAGFAVLMPMLKRKRIE